MKMPIWLLLAACIGVVGCNQPGPDGDTGGGGGQAAAPVVDVQRARDRLGEAYVHAARMHADVVRGNHDGAIAAVRDVRAELTRAKQTARLDTQARINEMDQQAIRVQREIERRALTTYQSTEKFVDQMQGLLASVPPQPISGGGGGDPAMGTDQRQPAAGDRPDTTPDSQRAR